MRNYHLLLFVLITILLPNTIRAQRVWDVDEHKYENTMNCTVQVFLDGDLDETLELGVFSEDECRGKCSATYYSNIDRYYWFLNIQGVGGESLEFFVRREGVELEVVTSYFLDFVSNGSIGAPDSPAAIGFVTPLTNYYTLVTDESQLIPGRQYLIADGYTGTSQVLSWQDEEEDERGAKSVSFSNRRVYQMPSYNKSEHNVYELTLGGTSENWTLYDAANQGYLSTTKKGAVRIKTSSPSTWTIDIKPNGEATIGSVVETKQEILFCDNSKFYCSESQNVLYLLAKCELLSGEVASLNVTDPTKMYVVATGTTCTIDELSTNNSSNLIVEDGAQLINASANVQATIQKNITAYDDADDSDGFYTLSSPIASAVSTCSNLIWDDYDLYRFNETSTVLEEWENYKNSEFTGFEAGRGYLYANGDSFTPCFKGVMNHNAVTVPLTYTNANREFQRGFNLIGNPYAHAIKKGTDCAIDNANLESGYYVLDHSGVWTVCTDAQAIEPCQGILVKTSQAGNLTINKVVATNDSRQMEQSQIIITVSDGKYSDRAIVSLDGSRGLEKIQHLNPEAPMVYVIQNGEDYAIAGIQKTDLSEVLVGFRAAHEGHYTITVETQGVDVRLIDNLTGEEDVTFFEAKEGDATARFKMMVK